MLDILCDYIWQTKNQKGNSCQEQNLLPESKNGMLKRQGYLIKAIMFEDYNMIYGLKYKNLQESTSL